MKHDNGSNLKNYMLLLDDRKQAYDKKVRVLIVSRLIVKNNQSSRLCTYLKEPYYVGTKNYPKNKADAVALVISFGRNNNRSDRGGSGGSKDADKPEAIVTLHLAADYDNGSSNNEYCDNDNEPIKYFEHVKY